MKYNYHKVEELYRSSGEKSIEFSRAIFGPKSKLGPQYFFNRKSITTLQLEKLANHYKVSIFDFFTDTDSKDKNMNISTIVHHNNVENVTIGSDVESLKQNIEYLQQIIKDKEDQINWFKNQWDYLIKTFQTSKK